VAHEKVTVSLVVDVAVIVVVLKPPEVAVEDVTPLENVAVTVSGYLRMIVPEPPFPPVPPPIPFPPSPP
jgi:hypothetical protein